MINLAILGDREGLQVDATATLGLGFKKSSEPQLTKYRIYGITTRPEVINGPLMKSEFNSLGEGRM